MEVWAGGVTYERSRNARMAESEQSADIYDRVYAAERPELFFKSAAWRVSGPGAPVSVRADSSIDVPEPELAVVLNAPGDRGLHHLQRHELTVHRGAEPAVPAAGQDLPRQLRGRPVDRPGLGNPDPYALTIELTISRDGGVAWAGTATTSTLHRKIDELAAWLFRENESRPG